jgi:hypothetical protein
MSKRMKVAFGCHLLALLLIAIMGVVYLSRTQFMPYHAMALGKIWPDIDQALQILLLALMKAFGGASLAVGVGMAILLFIPFRRGVLWARCAIPVVGVVAELPVCMPRSRLRTTRQPHHLG